MSRYLLFTFSKEIIDQSTCFCCHFKPTNRRLILSFIRGPGDHQLKVDADSYIAGEDSILLGQCTPCPRAMPVRPSHLVGRNLKLVISPSMCESQKWTTSECQSHTEPHMVGVFQRPHEIRYGPIKNLGKGLKSWLGS